jgi:hypothetical protein
MGPCAAYGKGRSAIIFASVADLLPLSDVARCGDRRGCPAFPGSPGRERAVQPPTMRYGGSPPVRSCPSVVSSGTRRRRRKAAPHRGLRVGCNARPADAHNKNKFTSDPQEEAQRQARYFEYSSAANPIRPGLTPRVPFHLFASSLST